MLKRETEEEGVRMLNYREVKHTRPLKICQDTPMGTVLLEIQVKGEPRAPQGLPSHTRWEPSFWFSEIRFQKKDLSH